MAKAIPHWKSRPYNTYEWNLSDNNAHISSKYIFLKHSIDPKEYRVHIVQNNIFTPDFIIWCLQTSTIKIWQKSEQAGIIFILALGATDRKILVRRDLQAIVN